MAWNDTLISDSAEAACWNLLGFSATVLDKRHDDRLDDVVSEGDSFVILRYKQTRVLYQIVDRASGNGLRLNAVFKEEDEDGSW